MNNMVIDRRQQRARAIKYEKIGLPDFDRTNNPFCWPHTLPLLVDEIFSQKFSGSVRWWQRPTLLEKATVGLLQ